MPKAARASFISASNISPTDAVSSKKSEAHPLVAIAMFSGIGLLVSLVAVLYGVQGVWE
jgi:hypothetical protein